MPNNPFTLSFGIEPSQYISRLSQTNEIIDSFTSENPSTYVYMISGIRGAGKTVMLTTLSDYFEERDGWIALNVSPETDMLNSIAAKLYSRSDLKKLFIKAKLDFSALGLGISIENSNQIFDMETALELMLSELKKKNKKVLIAIDEVAKNEHVKIFVSTFQILIRKKLPIFLVMTGLYDNIYNLQNEKTLTFLYRAPKIILEPLSLLSISRSYEKVFGIATDKATQMARLTKGYPFAYQALGYLYWKNHVENKETGEIEELLPQYDELLESYVYEKIWSELSPKEQEIVALIADQDEMKIIDIRDELGLTSGNMSVYRERLKRKGIIDTSKYGRLSLKLPRFGEIISYWVKGGI